MSGLSSRGYEARARECGLRMVRDSMERADMIAVYRIVTGVDRSDPHQFFRPAVARPGAMHPAREGVQRHGVAPQQEAAVPLWGACKCPVILARKFKINCFLKLCTFVNMVYLLYNSHN